MQRYFVTVDCGGCAMAEPDEEGEYVCYEDAQSIIKALREALTAVREAAWFDDSALARVDAALALAKESQ